MVLLDRQPQIRRHTPQADPPRPFWVRRGFWALVVLTAVIGAIVLFLTNAEDPVPVVNETATVYEMLPEYEVDTLANTAVAAKAGAAATLIERYAGLDANLDPDTPAWWLPEYEVATPAVDATFVPFHRYVGSSAAEVDPDQ